jgi:hypothetical protein
VQHWIAPLAVSGIALACSLTNDLSELEGTSDGGIGAGAGGIGGSGGGPSLCEAACDRQLTAACPNDELGSCITDCETAPGATSTECSTTWAALLGCVSQQGSFQCDASGEAELTNCTSQAEALGACLASGSGGTAGVGGTAGSGGTGTGGNGGTSSCVNPFQGKTCADLQADVCSDCTEANCCSETNACLADQDCGGLYACAATCAASTDPQACVSQTCPDCFAGLSLFNQLSNCIDNHCTNECSGQF